MLVLDNGHQIAEVQFFLFSSHFTFVFSGGDRTRELFDALNPTPKDSKLPPAATAFSQPTIYNDMPKTVDKLRTQNPVECLEHANTLAQQEARFREGFLLRSIGFSYRIGKELSQGAFGFTYESVQLDSDRKVWIKTEPMSEDTEMKKFKTLKVINKQKAFFSNFTLFSNCIFYVTAFLDTRV